MTTYKLLFTAIAIVCSLFLKAQSAPKLKFSQPQLVSGVNGQINATYKFSNVVPGIDAYVEIENLVGGAVLVNIDDSTVGYYDAWQPTVGGPKMSGTSYIKWGVEFKTNSGSIYTFSDLDASAIDIDGDNGKIHEFIGVNGQSSYDIPTLIPTLLTVTIESDTDNVRGDDPNPTNLIALGPVINRTNIDTFSQDVRINFHFINKSKIKIYTGSQVDANVANSATDRYHCIYFMRIKDYEFSTLPLAFNTFTAALNSSSTVDLFWITNAEIRLNLFEIERSYDQKEFKKIGEVTASGNLNDLSASYNFTDNANELKNHTQVFYRLKLIDKEGEFTYSIVKMIKPVAFENTEILVLPNPYMERLSVNFKAEEYNKAEVRLINMSGKIIASALATVSKGMNTIQLTNLNSKASGLYVVNLIIDGKLVSSQKVLKN